jgi:hypothetical protein
MTDLRAMAKRWIRGHPKAGRTWTIEDLVRDAEIAFPLGCAYCGVPFATARDRRRGPTIDVLGENMARGYPASTAFCCGSCNS